MFLRPRLFRTNFGTLCGLIESWDRTEKKRGKLFRSSNSFMVGAVPTVFWFLDTAVSKSNLSTYLRILKLKLGPYLTPIEVWTHNDQYWRSYGIRRAHPARHLHGQWVNFSTYRPTKSPVCRNFVNTDQYESILRQELALDLTSTSRYEDTKKDSIWIRPVSRNIEKCSHFKRNSKVDPGRMVGFPPLEL